MSDGLSGANELESARAAEAVRAELERRAVELARPLRETSATTATDFVLFRAGSETYAVDSSRVSAVFRLAEMTLVPGAPGYVRGLTLFKGQVLPVLDPRVLVGASVAALSDLARVVAIGGERGEFGLLADSIEGIRALAPNEIHAVPRQADDPHSPYVTGMTGDAVLVLAADALVRFFHGGG